MRMGRYEREMAAAEREILLRLLRESGYVVPTAARLAGVPERTFYRRLTRCGIDAQALRNGARSTAAEQT